MIFIKAFLVDGIICAITQFIMEKTKALPGGIMVGLVCTGVLLSFFGIYKGLADWAGAGATVPLLGFGHNLYEGMKEAVDKDGLIGLFEGGFTSSAVGVSAALIFSYIASLFFKSKMQ
ncbi:MAG: SpoVA/SpoVAEb family sporulation membrane protein [Lachnospiraceae bacterium]|nr:SpoVA/SpoVAEb family sporulation membrane protein [Lachnospiraceae bacterium]